MFLLGIDIYLEYKYLTQFVFRISQKFYYKNCLSINLYSPIYDDHIKNYFISGAIIKGLMYKEIIIYNIQYVNSLNAHH